MDLKENFAVNLIKFRKEAKLTQAELAEKNLIIRTKPFLNGNATNPFRIFTRLKT